MLNSSVGATGEWLSTGGGVGRGVASCKSCAVSPNAHPVWRLFPLLSPTCRVPQSAETVFFVID